MILVFDTETTGKAQLKAPPEMPFQPRIVQIAAIMVDAQGVDVLSFKTLIAPSGFNIPDEATAIHGITTEMAQAQGMFIGCAVKIIESLIFAADEVVGHNIEFDMFMLKIEQCRLQPRIESFCTMKAMTNHCKLPGNYGDYKWPKLAEAYKHAFGEDLVGAHDALADARATARLYRWLGHQTKAEIESKTTKQEASV